LAEDCLRRNGNAPKPVRDGMVEALGDTDHNSDLDLPQSQTEPHSTSREERKSVVHATDSMGRSALRFRQLPCSSGNAEDTAAPIVSRVFSSSGVYNSWLRLLQSLKIPAFLTDIAVHEAIFPRTCVRSCRHVWVPQLRRRPARPFPWLV